MDVLGGNQPFDGRKRLPGRRMHRECHQTADALSRAVAQDAACAKGGDDCLAVETGRCGEAEVVSRYRQVRGRVCDLRPYFAAAAGFITRVIASISLANRDSVKPRCLRPAGVSR